MPTHLLIGAALAGAVAGAAALVALRLPDWREERRRRRTVKSLKAFYGPQAPERRRRRGRTAPSGDQSGAR